jgi:hypothetical protein
LPTTMAPTPRPHHLLFFHPSFIHQPVLNLLSILHPLTTS